MIVFGFLGLTTLTAAALDLCLVLGPSTPSLFYSDFSARLWTQLLPQEVNLKTIQGLENHEVLAHCAVVLLATAELAASAQVSTASQELYVTVLSLSSSHSDLRPNYVHIDDFSSVQCLDSMLQYFEWTKIALFYGPNSFGTRMRDRAEQSFTGTEALVTSSDREQTISRLIATGIKKRGENIVVVGTEASSVPKLFNSLKESNLMKEGYAFVLVGEAVWGQQWQQWPGLLLLKEADCALANTVHECDAERVIAIIKAISSVVRTPICDLTADHFNEYFAISGLANTTRMVLMNTNYDSPRIVGAFSGSMEFVQTDIIYFPGNKTTRPVLSRTAVEISFNSGLHNPTTPPTAVAAGFYRGQELAVWHINNRTDVLPTKLLVSNSVSFGAAEWNETWATPRILASKDRIGVAYMTGYASEVTVNTLRTFAKLGMSHPSIASSNSIYDLSNSTEFPLFLRTGVADPYLASQFLKLMLVMRWKRCAVLYGDDVWSTNVYSWFERQAQAQQVTILNSPTLRRLPGHGTKEQYWTQCREHLLELFRCNARYVVLFLLEPVPRYVLELMFDLGARKGDFLFTGMWLPSNYANQGRPQSVMKCRELLEGAVGLMAAAWVGDIGRKARSDLAALFSDSFPGTFTCFYYDSTFALAYGIDSCIELGLNYEDPYKLIKCLRETRFKGCTGLVSWPSGDNNRVIYDYAILNLVRNETSGEFQLLEVGRYRPLSTQLYSFSMPVRFPGGAVPPPDLRVVFGSCPFEEKDRHSFPRGRALAIGICVIVASISIFLSLLIYRKAWSKVVPEMKKRELSVQDVQFMLGMGLEAAQLACIGPDFRSLSSLLMHFAQLLTVDLSDLVTFSKGVYWVTLDVVLAAVGVWASLNIFMLCRVEEKLEKWGCVRVTGRVAVVLLPQLTSVCFVPILSIAMDVYICDQAVGRGPLGFYDSVLSRDCYVYCWRGKHLVYVVVVSLALLVYVPTAILLRPVWQGSQSSLHIKTYPHAVVMRSLVQIFLVCLSKTAKRWAEGANGAAFLSVVAVYLLLSCKYCPYNYSRACLWHCISLLGIVVLGAVALVNSTVYPDSSVRLVIFVVVCWGVLASTV